MSRDLLEAFNIKKNPIKHEVSDFLAFKDKELVEKFRLKILEDISDLGVESGNISGELINQEIDDVTYGYDLTLEERHYLFNLIDGETNGYGPLTEVLKDDNINEIMVNSPKDIYIEIDGNLQRDESISFINDNHILRTIEKLLEFSGKTIDVNNPIVDARLEDGSRINAVIPPLSKNPIITIRKFKKSIEDMDTLVGNGFLTPYMARFLSAAVKAKLNIIVSGSSGSGKTSLLNILGNFIPESERIVTIEDVLELNLVQNHVVSLETKSANYDGNGEINVRQLVKNALRMRPDRIIIGEIRGAEAFDLLQAMNTGHEGSLTTLHANSAVDAIKKLETMVLMDGLEVPIEALREYIDNAIDIVVQITRMRDGKRRITNISEVIDVDNGEIVLNSIFDFNVEGINDNGVVLGEFILNDGIPKTYEKILTAGVDDLEGMFKKKRATRTRKK